MNFVQTLVALPDEGKILIMTLLSAGLTWLLLQVGKRIPVDLSGYGPALAAAIAPIITVVIEYFLQMIPATYDSIVLTVIHLIVVAVGSLGLFQIIAKVKAGQTRQLLG
jgi:hypothetical protein